MTIDDERPENELHADRASELLTVVAMIIRKTGGRADVGAMACPVCAGAAGGVIAYTVRDLPPSDNGNRPRRAIEARCSTPGCVSFSKDPAVGALPVATSLPQ